MPTTDTKSRPHLKIGETVSLEIEKLAPNGRGIATCRGETVSVKESLPGDLVRAQLTRVKPHQVEAKLLAVETASPERVVPRCEHFGPCGGCDLQHLAYPSQVNWKTSALTRILQREAGLTEIPPLKVISMEDPWSYRSKMEFSFGQEVDQITLGLHQRASFQRIVNIHTCHIAPGAVSDLLKAIRDLVNRFPLKSYNPKIHEGFWRYAVVRSSLRSRELMLLVVTNEGPREPIEALAAELPKRVPALKSFYWGISTRVSDVAQPERMVFVSGSEVLEDQVGEVRFQILPTNFVQPNLLLASRIYEAIRDLAALSGREAVYDLYCGMGLIALSLARKAKVVYGVESDAENVAFAQRNASLNGMTNATFLCGKVEDLLRGQALFKAGPKADVIVVDPPRAGLHKEVYAPLLEAGAATLMYLSCNPLSMARDLKVLLERDPHYRVSAVSLFDFFPHTTHLEVLVTLRRQ